MTFGTFYRCFCGRKTPNSRDYARDCPFPLAKFSRQSNSLIYWKKLLPKNYWAVFYDIWTVDRGDIGAYSIRKWGRFDLNWGLQKQDKIDISNAPCSKTTKPIYLKFSQKVQKYTAIVFVKYRSNQNHSFEDQKVAKSYKNSSSFNTWVTVVKQSWIIASMSCNNRIFLDMLRSLSLLGKSGAIQVRIFNIYINVINDRPPHMVLGPAQRPIVFGVDDVTDDVIMS